MQVLFFQEGITELSCFFTKATVDPWGAGHTQSCFALTEPQGSSLPGLNQTLE